MRRTGAWAVREGAGIIIHPSSSSPGLAATTSDAAATARTFDPIVIESGGEAGRERRSGGRSGEVEGETLTPEERERRVSVGVFPECDVEGSDEEALLVALKTAEVSELIFGEHV